MNSQSALSVVVSTDHTMDNVQAAVSQIVGLAPCSHCGLIAMLSVDFQGDPLVSGAQ